MRQLNIEIVKNKKKVITICCSTNFYKDVLGIEKELKKLGFKVKIPYTARKMQKTGNYNIDDYKTWFVNNADYKIKTKLMDGHFKKVLQADAVLVVNGEKNGIKGYIGGNALMEITLAYHYKKPIFIYNEISEDLNIKEEIYGVNPIFIIEDLNLIRKTLKL